MKTSTVAMAIMAGAADALLNLDVNLPLGIDVDLDILGSRPTKEPCGECLDTWHPPHDVIIDDCDDTGSGDWHWIHPGQEHHEPSYTWGTSTVTATHVSTIVSCGPEVPDCPADSTVYATVTATEQTTICPIPVEPTKVPEHPQQPEHPKAPEQPQYPEQPKQTEYPQVPEHPTSVYYPQPPVQSSPIVHPPQTLSTSVYYPEQPTGPVHPPVNTPVYPAPVATHPYGENATNPISTPPVVSHPPTAGAVQNVQSMGAAILAGIAAVALL